LISFSFSTGAQQRLFMVRTSVVITVLFYLS
jgi:hypothetical protein